RDGEVVRARRPAVGGDGDHDGMEGRRDRRRRRAGGDGDAVDDDGRVGGVGGGRREGNGRRGGGHGGRVARRRSVEEGAQRARGGHERGEGRVVAHATVDRRVGNGGVRDGGICANGSVGRGGDRRGRRGGAGVKEECRDKVSKGSHVHRANEVQPVCQAA